MHLIIDEVIDNRRKILNAFSGIQQEYFDRGFGSKSGEKLIQLRPAVLL
jgi:hypothetical protein